MGDGMETRQQDRAIALLEARGMVRLSEFIADGATAATVFHYALRQGRDGPKADVTRALQAVKEGLRLGKAAPAEIARYADQAGIWSKVQPYLKAMTVEGW